MREITATPQKWTKLMGVYLGDTPDVESKFGRTALVNIRTKTGVVSTYKTKSMAGLTQELIGYRICLERVTAPDGTSRIRVYVDDNTPRELIDVRDNEGITVEDYDPFAEE